MGASWRILFLSHDVKAATGGVRTLYAHAETLIRAGFDAAVVQREAGYRPGWFATEVPILGLDELASPRADDVIVVPEDHGRGLVWARGQNARRIVFCQNHFFALATLGENGDWTRDGFGVLCASRVIAAFLAAELGLRDLPVVPCAIEPDLFRPLAKRRSIAYMPRKRPVEAALIKRLFRHRFPRHDDIAFEPIQRLGERETAEILGHADVFLSLGRFEGFGLPPVEAMAAEAVVVGFHGDGGRDYATAENGVWFDEGALDPCVDALGRLCDLVKAEDPAIARMRAAGRVTAAAYSLAARDDALLAYWRSMAP